MTWPWPKKPSCWVDKGIVHISVPFTWNLPGVRKWVQGIMFPRVVVGGPAVSLMPEYLAGLPHVEIGTNFPGALQKVNPKAPRTTTGCSNKCGFCSIGKGLIEPGGLVELEDWPDRPIICDNNTLAASPEHFDRVMDRLSRWDACEVETDFNQGIDARLLNDHHAERIGRLKRITVRLALDHMGLADRWEEAFRLLLGAGMAKRRIRSYCLIGFDSGPGEAWGRCEWVEGHGVKALPMWFHPLDALEFNAVSADQKALGWTDEERKKIMQWYFQHRGSKPQITGHGGAA